MSLPAIHPARAMPFEALAEGLNAARAAGLVYRRDDTGTSRSLWCYTNRCVYEQGWNDFSTMARGLILDHSAGRVIATPFPKFFNAGESGRPIPDLPFETFEKVDGSLAIIHFHEGRWRAATKGAFDSPQALWTEARLADTDLSELVPGMTYLAEAIYPENRIVVQYNEAALVMLAAFAEDGAELEFDAVEHAAASLGWRTAARHAYASFADLVTDARALPATAEGFVIRFEDGLRLKIKGDEYRRIHAIISRCTPLAMWEAMNAGDDMEKIRRDLPEEFWTDFDAIVGLLNAALAKWIARIEEVAATVLNLTDKELGMSLEKLPADVRSYIFPWRKSGGKAEGKIRQALFREIKPTANELEGYTPSYAMGRVMEEMG